MITSISSETALEALAQLPFLTAGELAAVAGMPDRTARDVLRRLHQHRFIDAVSHIRSDTARVSRYCLAPKASRNWAGSDWMGQDRSI